MDAIATPPLSLEEAFASLPDVRQAQGRRHSLLAILNLTTVALLAGMKTLEAIAQFARDHGPELAETLGFTHWPTPCKATLSNVFRRLDARAYEKVLTEWLKQRCPDLGDTIALDGKTLRGSAGYQVPGVHLLAAYAPRVTAVIAQLRVDAKTNEHKAALEFLGVLPLRGKIVTGDAMFCQRDFCEKVIDSGGDYVVTVKENQPTVLQHIAAMFAEASAFSPLPTTTLAERAGPLGHMQQRTRAAREADATGDVDLGKVPGLARSGPGVSDPPCASVAGQGGAGDGVRHHQPESATGQRGALATTGARSLGDREPVALGTRRNAGRRRLSRAQRRGAASPGSLAERGSPSARERQSIQQSGCYQTLRHQATRSRSSCD